MHSTTKYLNGHSDVVGGIAVVGDGRDGLRERLGYLQNAVGAVAGPFDSFLVLRALKTLPVRMQRHCENAAAVAAFLRRIRKSRRSITRALPTIRNTPWRNARCMVSAAW